MSCLLFSLGALTPCKMPTSSTDEHAQWMRFNLQRLFVDDELDRAFQSYVDATKGAIPRNITGIRRSSSCLSSESPSNKSTSSELPPKSTLFSQMNSSSNSSGSIFRPPRGQHQAWSIMSSTASNILEQLPQQRGGALDPLASFFTVDALSSMPMPHGSALYSSSGALPGATGSVAARLLGMTMASDPLMQAQALSAPRIASAASASADALLGLEESVEEGRSVCTSDLTLLAGVIDLSHAEITAIRDWLARTLLPEDQGTTQNDLATGDKVTNLQKRLFVLHRVHEALTAHTRQKVDCNANAAILSISH